MRVRTDQDRRSAARNDAAGELLGDDNAHSTLVDAPRASRSPFRQFLFPLFWGLSAVAVLLAWPVSSATRATTDAGAWDLELAADGSEAVTALVFGDETGIHLMNLPPSGATAPAPRHLPVRLGAGDIHMISFGRAGLRVRTKSPPGDQPISVSAQARVVTLFSNAHGTGIRTGLF